MKRYSINKAAVVSEATAAEFEQALNDRLEELAKCRPEITFNMNEGHCAYILYKEDVVEPEDIRDEYEMRGETYTCSQCPFFKTKDTNKRRVRGFCPWQESTRKDASACLKFYKLLDRGEVEPC